METQLQLACALMLIGMLGVAMVVCGIGIIVETIRERRQYRLCRRYRRRRLP